jgi:TolA-binding protein
MRMGTLSGLLPAAAIFAAPAFAQEAPSAPQAPPLPPTPFTSNASGPQNPGWSSWADKNLDIPAGRNISIGFRALENRDFARAEQVFADIVQPDQRNARANFYLGATRMSLGKWQDAKQNLEIAANEISRHPDPKSRLGVTYAMLGDTAGANAQRAELVKMANACKLSPYIKDGLQKIDAALAEAAARG